MIQKEKGDKMGRIKTRICHKCDNGEFSAHQVCRVDIVVDRTNTFLANGGNGLEDSVYDSGTPYGPYVCTRCGKEYEELTDAKEVDMKDSVYVGKRNEGEK